VKLAEAKVTIAGMGLMGGSLGKALVQAGACREVRGLVRREEAIAPILSAKAAHRADIEPDALLCDSDLLVLSTPVRTIEDQATRLSRYLKHTAVLTDLGSVKGTIVKAMERVPSHVLPVGGHPMCGKEVSGLDAADPDLFRERIWVLTPLKRTPSSAMSLVQELIEAVGARRVIMDPETHDAVVACISHLPYLLATTLVAVAEEVSTRVPSVWTLAASGFRDTSRGAASDVSMMTDILAANKDHIRAMLDLAQDRVRFLKELVEAGDLETIERELHQVRTRRSGLFT
jgi:prephenate dehydrogenase